MKLRIRGNTLRLRLTQREVQQLRASDRVAETITFAPGRALEYALLAGDVPTPQARFEGERVEVVLPRAQAYAWVDGDAVGIEHLQVLDPGDGEQGLALLIEKDFQCLAPRAGEDDSDAFPHPGTESGAAC